MVKENVHRKLLKETTKDTEGTGNIHPGETGIQKKTTGENTQGDIKVDNFPQITNSVIQVIGIRLRTSGLQEA